ncbi:hypothetical protein B0H34DRAFT_100521 [Crassisporium funariophilum]|nr:hypothetical protein B0H34DRAFT_100521 [Crassisporium funariophilum]
MIRPPPLQLKRALPRFPHPVRTPRQPKSKSFVAQLYKASWKNPIIAVAGLNGLRYAFAAHNAFQDATVDQMEGSENLFQVSIALGVMYVIAFVVEIYGVISVSMQRLSMVRVYVYLTFLASLVVTSAGVLNGVSYFVFAEDLMWECISLASEGRGYEKSLFRGRPWPGSSFALREHDARKQCIYAWVHQSWSQVAAVFLFSLIPSVIYYLMVYTYYRQTINPKHSANLLDNRRLASGRMEAHPQVVYAAVGAREVGTGVTTSRRQQANSLTPRIRSANRRVQVPKSLRGVGASSNNATAGSSKRSFTSRSLQRNHRPPPLMQSPSPLGLSLSPGPPTYGPSRVYAAFAAPVLSTDYDKFV